MISKTRERDLIFIFGFGRSGTTLLGKIYDSSPDVLYLHEPDIGSEDQNIKSFPDRESQPFLLDKVTNFAEHLISLRSERIISSPPYFRKNFRSTIGNMLWTGNAYAVKAGARIGINLPVSDYIKAGAENRIVIKSVNSLSRAPVFHNALPHARFLHIVRHPCAVVASQMRGIESSLRPSRLFTEELIETPEAKTYGIDPDAVRRLGLAGQLAYEWMLNNDKVFDELRESERYKVIGYEHLCSNFEEVSRDVYAFASLKWQIQSSKFVTSLQARREADNSYFGIRKDPIKSMTRWKTELSESQIAEIESVVSESRLWRRMSLGA